MATIVKTLYIKDIVTSMIPVCYIDTINKNGFMAEMYNWCMRYIRENSDADKTTKTIYDQNFKRENYMATDQQNIYNNKEDGFWFVVNEKETHITLYKRETYKGVIYNSTYVTKILTLTCHECPRIVPQFVKERTLFENFSDELNAKVATHRKRTDGLD